MKSNPVRTVLEWALLTSLILSSFYFVVSVMRARELHSIQPQLQSEMMKYQSAQQLAVPLVNDVREYSKRDPGVIPILSAILGNDAASPTGAKPAGK